MVSPQVVEVRPPRLPYRLVDRTIPSQRLQVDNCQIIDVELLENIVAGSLSLPSLLCGGEWSPKWSITVIFVGPPPTVSRGHLPGTLLLVWLRVE